MNSVLRRALRSARRSVRRHTVVSRPVLVAIALAGLAGCHPDRMHGPGDIEVPDGLTPQEAHVAVGSNAFGLELLREVHPSAAESNLLLSPLSASMALGMTMNGAAGATFDAMSEVLGFGGLTQDEINEAYLTLIRRFEGLDPEVGFRLANSIWYKQEFDVNPDFFDRTRTWFDATVAPLDFLDPASPGIINAWVEEETEGRIRELIDSIDPLDRLFLINAVYFKAPWTQPFNEAATGDRPFVRADGSSVDVPTMLQDATFRWFRDDDVDAVELLYADSAFSMVVMAPAVDGERTGSAAAAAPGSLDALIDGLTRSRWDAWMERFEASRLMLMMPKFTFDFDADLDDPLDRMGMGIAFIPWQADFTRIAPVDDLHISRVRQKAFIDVHELGTEAAAATSVTVSVTSMPPLIHFDRPFLFAIRERHTGAILFIGRVGDPSA